MPPPNVQTNIQGRVSVVIAVFNGERYLAETIESILVQTEAVFEIVVVDDGSEDDSAAIADRFSENIRCFRRPHAGVSAALNFGVAQTKGDLLAFLDADDLWLPEKIAVQKAVLMRPGAPDISFGHAQPFLSPEITSLSEEKAETGSMPSPGFLKGTMLLSRSTFDRVGEFDTTRQLGDFIDWYLRAREAGLRSEMLPQVLLRRRIHETNTVTREKDRQSDYVKILKASLDRRRGAALPEN
jgi:glycosyltransferase involved in cell wall biosynthesis